MPEISFVVPAYNEEALLPGCLAAIEAEIARTGIDSEIIVVNNASTDRTRRLAVEAGAIVVDELERGLVAARRGGCAVARGHLIANIDADVLLPEGWLDTVLAEFAADPNLAALSGPVVHYDAPRLTRALVALFFRIAFVSYLIVRFVFRAGSMLQGGNFVIRRAALDAGEAFNSDFAFYGEDTEIARRLSKVGAVKFTFALTAHSSGRRLAAEGLWMVALRYSVNYLWAVMFGRPFTLVWRDFRHSSDPNDDLAEKTS